MDSSHNNPNPSAINTQEPKATTTMHNNDAEIIQKEINIVKDLTGYSSAEIQLNDNGWTSRVYIIENGKIVFKFPRMEAVKKEYVQEIKIYKLLEQLHAHLQVPKLRWTHENNDYFGYEGVIGTQFSSHISSLDEEHKKRLGKDIGEFLKQLHKLKLDNPHVMTVDDEIHQAQDKYVGCLETLQNNYSEEEVKTLSEFINQLMPLKMQELGAESKLCHGDLGYWNLLLKEDGSLGAIDFGDVGYYDISKDFCGLQDKTMLEAAIEIYGASMTLRHKIDIRQKFLPFFDLQYFAASGNEVETKATLAKIRAKLLT